MDLLELLDDAAGSDSTVRFAAQRTEPVPFTALWDEAEAAGRAIAVRFGCGITLGLSLVNTRECVVTLLGAWRAGCTVASLPHPANGMSAENFATQMARMCRVAGADALVTEVPDPLPSTDLTPTCTFEDLQGGGTRAALDHAGAALVQYTSGSVGRPKGVFLPLDRVGAHVTAILEFLEVGPGDATCSWLPLSHDMGLIGMLLCPLVGGSSAFGPHHLTLLSPRQFALRPSSWLKWITAARASITAVPTVALDYATRAGTRPGEIELSSLRACIVGAEPVRASTLDRFEASYSALGLSRAALCPAYGLAEAVLAVTMVHPRDRWRHVDVAEGDGSRPAVALGRPLPGTDVVIAGGAPRGEIRFASPTQLADYVGDELMLDAHGRVPTRDVGLFDGDELVVLGRADDVVIAGGRNIFPEDVEGAVRPANAAPGQVAAVRTATGRLAVVAETRSSKAPVEALAQLCRRIRSDVLAAVDVAPATVALTRRGQLPRTPSGKVRRFALRELLEDGDDGFVMRMDFD